MTKKLFTLYKIWLVVGLILWNWYWFYIENPMPVYVDLLIVIVYLGKFLWEKYKLNTLTARYPIALVYFVSAYFMVLFEETLAALTWSLIEGFSLGLFIVRIGQFWAFNVIVFSGVIIGMYMCNRFRLLGKKELFVLIALFGTYAEHLYTQGSPVVFFVYAPIVMLIYYLIFSPAITVLPLREIRTIHPFFRYMCSLIIVGIISLPFVIVLAELRKNNPHYFPPCAMINCD